VFCAIATHGQITYSKKVEEKIRQVEENMPDFFFKIEGKAKNTLTERMASYNVPGVSIAVIHDYKIEWAKGYGWADATEKRPVTAETMFQAASVSKSINGAGVLKLAQDKRLDLLKDINTYLKTWQFPYDSISKGQKITTMHLLSHMAGLPPGGEDYERDEKIPTLKQIFEGKKPARANPLHSESAPGLQFRYSNDGVAITQLIISDITKKPYEVYMAEAVLNPLGMNNSTFAQPPSKDLESKLATGYLENGQEVKGKYHIIPQQAAGGLWSTPTDICKFIIETQLAYEGKSEKILNQHMIKKQLTPYLNPSSALGVFKGQIGTNKFFTHSGSLWGFRCKYIGNLETGDGVVIMANSENAERLIEDIIVSVAEAYEWKTLYINRKAITQKIKKLPDSSLNKFIGQYKFGRNIWTITKKDSTLRYKYNMQNSWELHFTSDSTFFSMESVAYKRAYFDSNGNVMGFMKSYDHVSDSIQKIELANLTETVMKNYSGEYQDGNDRVKIFIKDRQLYLKVNSSERLMKFFNQSEFFMDAELGAVYSFNFDSKGKVVGYTGRTDRLEQEATKIK
jgi:CubicO group peptidase (beta-lactamase class C family)